MKDRMEVYKMKLVDEIYEYYHDKLTGDEEDIDMLTFAILEELSYDDLMSMLKEIDKQELYDLVGLYLIEGLKEKFAQENYGQKRAPTFQQKNLH
jgi:hypothetical protein